MQKQRLALALCSIHEAQKGCHLSQEASHQPCAGQECINSDPKEGITQRGQQPTEVWGEFHARTRAGSPSLLMRMLAQYLKGSCVSPHKFAVAIFPVIQLSACRAPATIPGASLAGPVRRSGKRAGRVS